MNKSIIEDIELLEDISGKEDTEFMDKVRRDIVECLYDELDKVDIESVMDKCRAIMVSNSQEVV